MKLTPSQNALLAGLATLLITSLSEFLAGIRPFLANGKIDWNGVAIFIVGTALPTLGAGIVTYISTHQQQILQAAEDTAQELHIPASSITAIHALLGEIKGLLVSQTTTPPTVNVTVPPAPQPQQTPLQGLRLAENQAQQQPSMQFVAPQRASVPQPQQAFPAPQTALAGTTMTPETRASLGGVNLNTTPAPSGTPLNSLVSQDTTPRVAALLAQFGQNQNQ